MADIQFNNLFVKNFFKLAAVFMLIQGSLIFLFASKNNDPDNPEASPFIRQNHVHKSFNRALRGHNSDLDLPQSSMSANKKPWTIERSATEDIRNNSTELNLKTALSNALPENKTESALADDGEALVQEVLRDVPLEDKGEREEWKSHVGWHRKEDMRNDQDGGTAHPNEVRHKAGGHTGKLESAIGQRITTAPESPTAKLHGNMPLSDNNGTKRLETPSLRTRKDKTVDGKTETTFLCADGIGTPISFLSVNDGYCDCHDGSDEYLTSGCAGLEARLTSGYIPQSGGVAWTGRGKTSALLPALDHFRCSDLAPGVKGKTIFSSRVGDGVCDCCDGSDENNLNPKRNLPHKVFCPDTCAAARAKVMEQRRRFDAGSTRRRELYLGRKQIQHAKPEMQLQAEQVGGGKDNAFFGFASRANGCVSFSRNKFRYELCLFGMVRQFEGNADRDGILLGKTWEWVEVDRKMLVKGGTGGCPGFNKERYAEVTFECGAEDDTIVRVEEPETCYYEFLVSTPAACVDEGAL